MFENATVNLNALFNSCAKIACCSSQLIFTFLYADSSVQHAKDQFVSCIHISFVKQPNKPKCNEVRSGDSNRSISVTIQNQIQWTSLLTLTNTITYENIHLSSSPSSNQARARFDEIRNRVHKNFKCFVSSYVIPLQFFKRKVQNKN
jgi:hypothetical protein